MWKSCNHDIGVKQDLAQIMEGCGNRTGFSTDNEKDVVMSVLRLFITVHYITPPKCFTRYVRDMQESVLGGLSE